MSSASHDSLSWLDMYPAEFDAAKATPAHRKIIREAQDTLFPRLLPEPVRKPARTEGQLPGQDDLFGGTL